MSERNLHRDFAKAYSRAERDYQQASYRGDMDRMDQALSRKQELEKGVSIVIHNPTVLRDE